MIVETIGYISTELNKLRKYLNKQMLDYEWNFDSDNEEIWIDVTEEVLNTLHPKYLTDEDLIEIRNKDVDKLIYF